MSTVFAVCLGLPGLAAGLALLVAWLLNRDPPELRTRTGGRYLRSLWEANMAKSVEARIAHGK